MSRAGKHTHLFKLGDTASCQLPSLRKMVSADGCFKMSDAFVHIYPLEQHLICRANNNTSEIFIGHFKWTRIATEYQRQRFYNCMLKRPFAAVRLSGDMLERACLLSANSRLLASLGPD